MPGQTSSRSGLAEPTNAIVRWTEFECGGHFATMEEPDLTVADLRDSFRPYRTQR